MIFSMIVMFRKNKLLLFGTLLIVLDRSLGVTRMEDFCNQELRLPLQWIYQTKLQLTDDDLFEKPDSDYPYNRLGYCETIIETWYYSFTRLMFYFEDLDLDCDKGHLEFYVGENSDDRIKGSCPSYGYVCDNSLCIEENIRCNGFDSCGDGSGCDLTGAALIGVVIGGIVGVLLIISIIVSFVCCFIHRKDTAGTLQNTAATTQAVTYESQAASCQPMIEMNQGSTFPTNTTTYPVDSQADVANRDIDQQVNYRASMIDFKEGTNFQYHQTSYDSHPETSGDIDLSAPPPSYDEIIANSRKLIVR
ncbi:uncharacterized protein LOC132753942 isoform X3 [Ruditapes philippinarum]|uniref:uncharacterized protein LOC132753942 isoform X3 n=1 Tax=Ruditapes philippinarum TaxID=129788 RepID=UPI00295A980B|nr:uncharacterized protein LOC132753942 isoform X3 [Ruditapes philippinarum]